MFHPVHIKHECSGMDDVRSAGTANASDNTKYSTFSDDNNVEYKYSELPQFWNHTQLPNETRPKNGNHGQQTLYTAEESNSLVYMKNCVQNNTLYPVDQDGSLNQIYQQCHMYMSRSDQPQHNSNIQTVKIPNQMVAIPGPIASIKAHNSGRSPMCSTESNVREKAKCQCEICFKKFGHRSNLFIHMRIHNGERPYKCTQCEKCFTHSGNLVIHMRTHSGERPYGCQICGKMFSHSGNLSTHLRTHSGVKPYKCAVCGKEFRHSGNLSIHERIHSGIKPFQCKICGKDFYHSGNLTTHMKKHTANIKANISQFENDEKNIMCTAPLNSFGNFALESTEDVKTKPCENNMVPIKNECNDEASTNVAEITTLST